MGMTLKELLTKGEGTLTAGEAKTLASQCRMDVETLYTLLEERGIKILDDEADGDTSLDVEGITQVVNYDIPHDPDWYVHRIGRTGRAGSEGTAITFYTADETRWLQNLEKKLAITLERQNLAGEKVRRTVKPVRPKKKRVPKRGKSAVGPNKRGTKYAEASRKQKKKEK